MKKNCYKTGGRFIPAATAGAPMNTAGFGGTGAPMPMMPTPPAGKPKPKPKPKKTTKPKRKT